MTKKAKSLYDSGEAADKFVAVMKRIDLKSFIRLMTHCGLTAAEVREACEAFRSMKG